MGGGPGGGATLIDALHGAYVVSDGDGGYTTELMQTGEVTAMSDDGYTRTSTIDADTVLGNGNSDTATADSVSEAGRPPARS
jgi:hypothetical protein